jgi:hypothetical protein
MTNDLTALNLTTVPDDIGQPAVVQGLLGGIQAIWRFPNGQGASVVNHRGSYGTELAVLRFNSEDLADFDLDYSTPVADDVIGHIDTPEELLSYLRRIRDLPRPEGDDTGSPSGSGSDYSFMTALDSMSRMSRYGD